MIEAAYDILRVEKNASPETVRKAYVRLVRRYPPEHFPEKFAQLCKAYQQLTMCDDFINETINRIMNADSVLELAACLFGDRRELKYDGEFNPGELISLFEGEEIRRDLSELLASTPDVEWRIGDNK